MAEHTPVEASPEPDVQDSTPSGLEGDLEKLLSDLKSPELYSLRGLFNMC